jgi:hypothetical protein
VNVRRQLASSIGVKEAKVLAWIVDGLRIFVD